MRLFIAVCPFSVKLIPLFLRPLVSMQSILKLCIFACLLCIQTGCDSTPLKDAGPGFSFVSSINFADTRGLIGNYLRTRLTARCNGPWGADNIRVQGSLPPGITSNGTELAGTPLRAGAWYIQAKVSAPHCNGVVYDDKLLWVNFTIEGGRPQRGL